MPLSRGSVFKLGAIFCEFIVALSSQAREDIKSLHQVESKLG